MERFDQDWDGLAHQLGFLCERDMLEDFYLTRQLSIGQIAERLMCGTATISRRLDMLQISKRKRGGPNNAGKQNYKLFHLDQRIVLRLPLNQVAAVTGISRSMWYKYRRQVLKGDPNAFLRAQSDRGTGEVQQVVNASSSVGALEQPRLHGLLPEEEVGR